MSSRIEHLIDEIEEYIDGCKYKFMSNTEIIVDKGQMDELLRELRMKTPDEIKRYQKIISQKEAILNDAKQKAEALINEATIHTNQLINEHEIMQQAYAQANEVVSIATRQAQEVLDNATMEANSVRMAAMQYMDDILAHLETVLISSIGAASQNYETLLGSLTQYKDIIQSNRNELHPVEDEVLTDTLTDIPVDEISDEMPEDIAE